MHLAHMHSTSVNNPLTSLTSLTSETAALARTPARTRTHTRQTTTTICSVSLYGMMLPG